MNLTTEPLDMCLKKNIINIDQHRSGIKLRWFYTVIFEAPTIQSKLVTLKFFKSKNYDEVFLQNLEKKYISYFLDFKIILKSFNHDKNIIHIFGSPFENLSIVLTLILAILFKQKIYLISEPYSIVDFGYLHDSRFSILYLGFAGCFFIFTKKLG
jgi:hypothetical protein